MRIDIWSDVVCPWCYIGKRRLEEALASFEHADEVEIVWRAFQLDPGAPAQPDPTTSMAEHLGRKYGGGPAAGQQMVDQMEAVAAEAGLLFRLGTVQRAGTLDAHRLLHAAGECQGDLKEALLHAYFVDNENVADHATLTRIAAESGLDAEQVAQVLASRRYAEEVEADLDQAAQYGVSGVPFFVIDEKFAIPGAQSVEVFTQALDRAWADAHPVLQTIGAQDGADGVDGVCGPDGCAV